MKEDMETKREKEIKKNQIYVWKYLRERERNPLREKKKTILDGWAYELPLGKYAMNQKPTEVPVHGQGCIQRSPPPHSGKSMDKTPKSHD